ncbi:hypothetical protein GCM10010401_18190 [Rarobacter faecitabidus]
MIAWAALAVAVATPVVVLFAGGTVLSGLTAALPCAVVWLLFFDPCVAVTERGVEVRNVLRTVSVPWDDVSGARVRYSFELLTRSGRAIEAWALARGSRGRPSLADEAAAAVTAALERGSSRRAAADEGAPGEVVTWNSRGLAVLAVCAALSAIGLLG